jgi:putative hemolysin
MDPVSYHVSRFVDYLSFDTALLAQPAMIARLTLQAALLFCSSFFSGSETALFSLSDVDLEQLRRKRHPRADLLHNLLNQPRRLIVSILCGNELINIAATANMTGILVTLYGNERAGLISILVMVPLLLLFGEITPKTIAVSYPVQVSTDIVCGLMNFWMRFVTPLRWAVRLVADRVTTWIVGEARDADHLLRLSEFRSLVAEIEEEGLLNATERVLVYNLLDAGSTEIVHVMTPRTEVQFVSADKPLSQVAEEISGHKRLRMPVYERTRDDVIGFVHAEDLTGLILDGKDLGGMSCRDILRPNLYVPLTKSVDEMLDFFQSHNERAAMVLNEYGGVSGIVTMEDVLNFIFGEIAGEFIEATSYEREAEQIFVVPGSMRLIDFEALTNFGIEDPRLTTIGGVAFRHLGHVPEGGESVTVEGIRMTVVEMDGNRIARLRVAKEPVASEPVTSEQ